MLGLAALPSLIMFFGCLFLPESPRWLLSKGYGERAKAVLMKLRGASDVSSELEAMKNVVEEESSMDVSKSIPRVVTKGRGPGISPGYSEHGPRLLSSLN